MKKIFKRIIAGMTAAISIASVSTSAFAYADVSPIMISESQSVVTATETFTSGDYTYFKNETGATITKYSGSDTAVVIPSVIDELNVTSIGASAFKGINTITSVVIPDTVTYIGESAFRNCTNLKKVTLNEGLKELAYASFANVPIEEIYIPASLTASNAPFAGCANLNKVTFGEGITSIPYALFSNFNSLKSITIPDTVTYIGEKAFENCDGLTEIEIPKNVEIIDNYAFRNCDNLAKVTLNEGLKKIYTNAFSNLPIEEIYIPASLTYSNAPFAGCANLNKVTFGEGITSIPNALFSNFNSLKSITIPDTVTYIGEKAFENCDGLTEIEIPKNVEIIDNYAFRNCDNLAKVTLNEGLKKIYTNAFSNLPIEEIYIPASLTYSYIPFAGCANLNKVTFGEGITSIPYALFSNFNSLKSITIPDTVTYIGENAFENCDGLTEITIPETVKKIDQKAFRYSDNLTNVNIEDGVESIGYNAFSNTGLTSLVIPASVKTLTDAFNNNPKLVTVEIIGEQSSLSDNFMSGNSSLEKIIMPYTIKSFGKNAFYGCSSLKTIECERTKFDFGSALSTCYVIKDQRVNYCDITETNMTADKSCENIGGIVNYTVNYSLVIDYRKSDLQYSIELIKGDGLEIIPSSFKLNGEPIEVTDISQIPVSSPEGTLTFSAKIDEFENDGMTTCDLCSRFVFGSTKQPIGYVKILPAHISIKAPENTTENKATISGTFAKGIEVELYVNGELSSTATADSMTGKYTFDLDLSGAKNGQKYEVYVQYGGAKSETKVIEYSGTDSTATTATTTKATTTSTTTTAKPTTSTTSTTTKAATSTTTTTAKPTTSTTSTTTKAATSSTTTTAKPTTSTTSTTTKAATSSTTTTAKPTTSTTSATTTTTPPVYDSIPDGEYTFGDYICTKTESGISIKGYNGEGGDISIPSEFENIPVIAVSDNAFKSNKKITGVDIPSSVRKIGSRAFYACENLTKVTLHEGLESMLNCCFSTDPIEEIYIPKSLSYASEPFANCSKLNKVTFADGITKIPDDLFKSCSGLTEIDIPETVKTIGSTAFYACENLTKVTLHEGLESLQNLCFSKDPIEEIYIPKSLTFCASPFDACSKLNKVTYGEGITTIPDELFMACTGLTGTLELPETVTKIGQFAFDGCVNITELKLHEGIEFIGQSAFRYLGITSLVLPSTLKHIDSSFGGCDKLKNVELLSELKKLPASFMAGNENLETVKFPASVEEIGYHAFDGCTNLTKVDCDRDSFEHHGAFSQCYKLKDQRFTIFDLSATSVTVDKERCLVGDTVNFTVNYKILDQYINEKDEYKFHFEDKDGIEFLPETYKFNGESLGEIEYPLNFEVPSSEGTLTFSVKLNEFKYTKTETGDVYIGLYAGSSYQAIDLIKIEPLVLEVNSEDEVSENKLKIEGTFLNDAEIEVYVNDELVTTVKTDSKTGKYSGEIELKDCEDGSKYTISLKCGNIVSAKKEIVYRPEKAELALGDANGDNIIDSRDASLVLMNYASSSTEQGGFFTEDQIKAGDVNKDNKLDARDASLILSYYAVSSARDVGTLEEYITSLYN